MEKIFIRERIITKGNGVKFVTTNEIRHPNSLPIIRQLSCPLCMLINYSYVYIKKQTLQ